MLLGIFFSFFIERGRCLLINNSVVGDGNGWLIGRKGVFQNKNGAVFLNCGEAQSAVFTLEVLVRWYHELLVSVYSLLPK